MLARYAVGREVFVNKRKLKGKRLLITESLTYSRMQLLGEAQKIIWGKKCLDI